MNGIKLEISVNDIIVEEISTTTAPPVGALVEFIDAGGQACLLLVTRQVWYMHGAYRNQLGCRLECVKQTPRVEVQKEEQKPASFKTMSGHKVDKCSRCSFTNPIAMAKCQDPECPCK